MIKSNIRYLMIIINFVLAYTHVYKNAVLKADVFSNKNVMEILVYSFVTIISIALALNEIISSLKGFNSDNINDVLSYTILALLISSVFSIFITNNTTNNMYDKSVLVLLINIMISVVLVPIYEEIVFRLAFYKLSSCILNISNNKMLLISINAILFSFLHLINFKDINWIQFIPYFGVYLVLGIATSYIYLKKDNIVSSILLHSFWNGFMYLGSLAVTLTRK